MLCLLFFKENSGFYSTSYISANFTLVIPIPVSSISIYNYYEKYLSLSVIEPELVNLIALVNRFKTIYFNRFWSLYIVYGSDSISKFNVIFLRIN